MTVVASSWAVAIALVALMDLVGAGLIVRAPRVAVDARKAGVVRGDLVAIAANRAIMRNAEKGVVKRRAEPTRGCVTARAGRWVSRRDMVWHAAAERLRTVPVGQVAAVAVRWQSS